MMVPLSSTCLRPGTVITICNKYRALRLERYSSGQSILTDLTTSGYQRIKEARREILVKFGNILVMVPLDRGDRGMIKWKYKGQIKVKDNYAGSDNSVLLAS